MNEAITNVTKSIWDVFSIVNGNPIINYDGIRFFIGIFFTAFLLIIIKMRALNTMEKKHIVAMVGALLLLIRYLIMLSLQWGYQINMYTDPIIFFLYPPLEHFFLMLGLGCLAYYSLNHYEYYPGILKKILWAIPVGITIFFIHATIAWKTQFLSSNVILSYNQCVADWQTHFMLTLMAAYVVSIAGIKFSNQKHFLSAFWTVVLINHVVLTITTFIGYENTTLTTILNSLDLWCIPILILHFIKAYVVRLGFCDMCTRMVKIN